MESLQRALTANQAEVERELARAAQELAALPETLKALAPAPAYPVEISAAVRALSDAVDRRLLAGR